MRMRIKTRTKAESEKRRPAQTLGDRAVLDKGCEVGGTQSELYCRCLGEGLKGGEWRAGV